MASLVHNRPKQYRQRADELRAKADATTDSARRSELLQIADTWERMAEYEEKHPVFGGLYGPPPTTAAPRRGNDPAAGAGHSGRSPKRGLSSLDD